MEDHDEKRRLCEPHTWNLQKHFIVDFIQKVYMACREALIKKKRETFATLGSDPPLFSGKCNEKPKKKRP